MCTKRSDKGGKAINRPWWQNNYNIAIKHWSNRCAEDECASRDTGVQRTKINQINSSMGMRQLDGMFTDRLCTAAVICELLWQLVLKVSEEDMSLQIQSFLQFVPVIGSGELEGKASKGGICFGSNQWNIPAGARATGGCCYGDQWAEIRRDFT